MITLLRNRLHTVLGYIVVWQSFTALRPHPHCPSFFGSGSASFARKEKPEEESLIFSLAAHLEEAMADSWRYGDRFQPQAESSRLEDGKDRADKEV
jgi:hypothetical protein